MRHIVIILMAFCVTGYIVKAQQCENGLYYFKEGANWELSNYNKKDKYIGYTTFNFSNITISDSVLKGKLHSVSYDEKKKELAVLDFGVQCNNGNIMIDMESVTSEKQLESYKKDDVKITKDDALLFPKGLEIGAELPIGTLNADLQNDGTKVAKISYHATERKVLAKESITVPAGTFECYKISTKIHSITTIAGVNINFDYVLIEWYAYGVGVVRSETYRKGELETYSVLTKLSK